MLKYLDDYEEYQQIKDLIETDEEFKKGENIRFSSLDILDKYFELNKNHHFNYYLNYKIIHGI